MRVSMASLPGHGRPNEDFVGAVPGVVVVVDGAGIPRTGHLCHHGIAWYARSLGSAVLARLVDPSAQPVDALADAVQHVADQHRGTCDITHPSSPQATVAVLKVDADRAHYLVLADAFLALDLAGGGHRVVTDPREAAVRDRCAAYLAGLTEGTPDHAAAWQRAVDELIGRRNRAGGYWIAKDDPSVAAQAVTGSVPLADLQGVALLSNGAARIVSPYGLAEWPDVLAGLRAHGAAALLDRVRTAEAGSGAAGTLAGFRSADDASAAYCDLTDR